MTETEVKLRDAATQMRLLLKNDTDEQIVRSCINSYISFGRSVTFLMQKESSYSPELLSWYKKQMKELQKLPIMRFFNEKRVHSIHRGVVKPNLKSAPIYNLKINGIPQPGSSFMFAWQFDDVKEYIPNDSGNMLRLCEEYFRILKSLVSSWLQRRKELCLIDPH